MWYVKNASGLRPSDGIWPGETGWATIDWWTVQSHGVHALDRDFTIDERAFQTGMLATSDVRQHLVKIRDGVDAVVLDYSMPEMDGVTAISKIRDSSPSARLIVLTTYDGDEDIYRALLAIVGEGTTTLFVEQDVGRALAVCDRLYCFQEGRISLEGRPRDLTRAQIAAAYFGV